MNKILYPLLILMMATTACQFNTEQYEPREEVEAPWWRSLYFYGEVNDDVYHIPPDTVTYIMENRHIEWSDSGYNHIAFLNNMASPGTLLNVPQLDLQMGPLKNDTNTAFTHEDFFNFFEERTYELIRGDATSEGVVLEFTFFDQNDNLVSLATNGGRQPSDAGFEIISTRDRVITHEVGPGEDPEVEVRKYIRARFNGRLYHEHGSYVVLEDGEVITYFVMP